MYYAYANMKYVNYEKQYDVLRVSVCTTHMLYLILVVKMYSAEIFNFTFNTL